MTETINPAPPAESQHGGRRLSISLIIALLLHGIAFIVVQWLIPLTPEEELEYTGPLYVTIEEYEPEIVKAEPEITEVTVPAQQTAPSAASIEAAAPEETVRSARPRTIIPQAVERPEPSLSTPPEYIQRPTVPHTTQPAEEERIIEGIRRVIIPAEEEKLPAGLEVPTLEESSEPATLPPEFLDVEEEKPLHFNLSRLDEALVTDQEMDSEAAAVDEGGRVAPGTPTGAAGSDAASPGAPVITWEEEGHKRVLLSPINRPEIPSWVEQEGLNLRVLVSFAVTPEGHTTSLRVERSSGYSDVDASILETVRKLRFNPVATDRNVLGRIDYLIRAR